MITRFRSDKIYSAEELISAVTTYLKKLPQTIESIGTPLNILRYEFPCKEINILDWLYAQTSETKIYWSDRDGKKEVGGVDSAEVITSDKNIDYKKIFEHIEDRLSSDNPYLQYYGGFCFDEAKIGPEWKNLGTYQFIIPQFEFYREGKEFHFAINIAIKDVNLEFTQKLIQQLSQLKFSNSEIHYSIPEIKSRIDNPDQQKWQKDFSSAQEEIQHKKLEKIVLARKSTFTFTENLDAVGLLIQLKKETPHCFHFCFQTNTHSAFLGASPERLYKKDGSHFQTEALAGTMPRHENPQKDKLIEKELLNSSKNLNEHKFVVNSIKESIQQFTKKLNIDSQPKLLKLQAGHHLMTKFEGELNPNVHDHDILQHIHPTPAVAGYPIDLSIKSVRALESFSRGWYAGPIGCIGFDQTELVVGIRSALLKNNQLSLFAGAGIIAESIADNEWDEIENKVSTFLKIFNHETSKST